MDIKIVSRWDSKKVLLCGKYESIKDCLERNTDAYLRDAYLRDANLTGADLTGANLRGANLTGANLRDVDLRDAKEYQNSHDFWAEIVKRQPIKTFTDKEWSIIGQIIIHRICWDSIKKRYGKKAMPIFKKLSKSGFGEFEKSYKEVLGGR